MENWWSGVVDGFNSKKGANALIGLGSGLLSQPTFAKGLAAGGQGFMQGSQIDQEYAAEEAKLADRNVTMEWVKANYPEYATLPVEQAADLAFKMEAAKKSGANAPTFFGTPIWGTTADGSAGFGQLNNQGQFQLTEMPEGFQVGKDPIKLDAGDHFVLLDPVTRQPVGQIPKNGDIPTGYNQTGDGQIAPMPGGEQDRARIEADLQATQRAGAADQRADVVINAIDTALGQAHWSTTGPVGSAGRAVGMTGAVDLEKTIDTVIANIGFNELQQMREMSPTGGALGQVAVQELGMLQSVLASLDPRQGEEQLRRNLETVKTLLERQKMFRQQAIEERQNSLGGGQQAPVAGGGVDDILSGYGL